jgi:phenylalanyl-tRNA synthetase beta chain
LFELDLDACLARPVPHAAPLPKLQSVIRDLALVVPDRVNHDALIAAAMADATGLMRSVQLFDLFKPNTATAGIGIDERSMAVRIELRDDDATLTDERIEAAVEATKVRLQSQLGARLRA